jgi:hypothetical protein
MKKIGIVGIMILAMGIPGCGSEPTWIGIWSGASHPTMYFIVENVKVPAKDIGREYRVLNTTNHAAPETSNRLPRGTRIYTIRGKNPSKELAVEIGSGNFTKATYSGTNKPS